MSVDIEIENKEVSVEGQSVDVVGSNEVNVDICKQEDISVSVKKREYVVTSDDIFIGQQGSFLPDPVRSLISETISTTLSGSLVDLSNANGNISAAIQAMTDISNGFESTIISVANDLEGFVNAEINGLNSTYQSTKADVDTVKATYVDGDQALAIATTAINSESGPDGSIRASVLDFMSTYTNQTEANAISIDSIASQITDEDTGLTAAATAVTTLNTTVGIDDTGSITGTGILSDIEILQKQNDGVVITTTGDIDVDGDIMIGIEDPNNNTDNDQLDVNAEPYSDWTPLNGTTPPTGSHGIDRVYEDTVSGLYYKYTSTGWVTISQTEFNEKKEFLRKLHIGDSHILYRTVNGNKEYIRAYKFIKTSPDVTSPFSTDPEGYTWSIINDTDAQNAYIAALKAYDLADGKRRVFTATPVGPYDIGDLWTRTINGSEQIWRANTDRGIGYLLSEWQQVATDDTYAVELQDGTRFMDPTVFKVNGTTTFQDYLTSQLDAEIVVFSGTDHTAQTGMKVDDIYIEKTTATGASGVTVDVLNTYTYNGVSWDQIGNNTNITALADLADGKRTIYSNASNDIPIGDENDIWIPTTGTNDITYIPKEVYQSVNGSWVIATKYTEDLDTFVGEITPQVVTLQNQVDGKIEYYYYDNPTNNPLATIAAGWGEAEHGNVVYYKDIEPDEGYWYNSTIDSFEQLTDTSILKALKEAEKAKATADGKVNHFYAWKHHQDVAPNNEYRYWLKTDNIMYYKNGAIWESTENNESFDLDAGDLATIRETTSNGKIDEYSYEYTGSSWQKLTVNGIIATSSAITDIDAYIKDPNTGAYGGADSSVKQEIKSEVKDGKLEVESKWEYNSEIIVNGVAYNTGFGLTSTGSQVGTYAQDGVNYPLFNSEFWIDAEKFKFTNSNQTGQVSPFTIDASGSTPNTYFNGIVNFGAVNANAVSGGINLIDSQYAIANASSQINLTGPVQYFTDSGYFRLLSISDSGEPTIILADTIGTYNIPMFPENNSHFIVSFDVYVHPENSPSLVDNVIVEIVTDSGSSVSNTVSAPIYNSRVVTVMDFSSNTGAFGQLRIINKTNTGLGHTQISITNVMIERRPSIEYIHQGFVFPTGTDYSAPVSSTTIDGNTVTLDTLTARNIKAGSVSADRLSSTNGSSTVWEGGGLVSQNFNGNPHGDIGTPTSGFRLSSDASGTVADPNIYGAYVKASTLESATMIAANGSRTGKMVHSQSGSDNIYGMSYGTGHIDSRLVKANSFATVHATADLDIPEDIDCYFALQAYNGATGLWFSVSTASFKSSGGRLLTQLVLTYTLTQSGIISTSYTSFRVAQVIGAATVTNINTNVVIYNI